MLVVQGGINDIAQGRDVEPAAENLRGARPQRQGAGPLGSRSRTSCPGTTAGPRAEAPINRLNGLIRELAAAEDVPVLPFYETLESPDAPGRMRDEWTSDGDHPSIEGYRRLGELAFRLP